MRRAPGDPAGGSRGSGSIRRRVALELAVLAVLAPLYLALLPERPPGLDLGLALTAFGLIGLSAKRAREQIWGPPAAPGPARVGRATVRLLVLSLPVALGFAVHGAVRVHLEGGGWNEVLARLFRPPFFAALVLFVPWALLQQTLFQFYLLGRLKALLPRAAPLGLACANGILFGAVHLPDWELALLAVAAGTVWSHSYYRDRSLLATSLSHALLGTTYFYWARDRDLVRAWLGGTLGA